MKSRPDAAAAAAVPSDDSGAVAAATALRWLLIGGCVLVALRFAPGVFAPAGHYLLALTFATYGGSCLARHWGAGPPRRRIALVSVVALLLAVLPTRQLDPWSVLLALVPPGLLLLAPVVLRKPLNRVPDRWVMATPAILAAVCFLVAGAHIYLSFLLIPVFFVSVGIVLQRSAAAPRRAAVRIALAVTLGFGSTWLGIAQVSERVYLLHPDQRAEWRYQHGASDDHYPTLMVAGFPLMRVEGHGLGGARERLPPGKGLGALVANFLLCTAAAGMLVWWLPARLLLPATAAGLVFAWIAGGLGWWQLMCMLD